MKRFIVFVFVSLGLVFANGLTPEEVELTQETCCTHGESVAPTFSTKADCSHADLPEYIMEEEEEVCRPSVKGCCEKYFESKENCADGMKLAAQKRCSVPKTDIGKTCCEECNIGRLTGESQGKEACGSPAETDLSPNTILRKNAYYQCCVEAADKPETTTEKKIETTTQKKVEKCTKDSCDHSCDDSDGKITCSCQYGYRLKKDRKTCKDINECAEAIDDLCTQENTVCHNIPGSFKCVPLKKRDVSLSCPPGFKRNIINQVCDDINECQLPRPPCPKYLCENTIGGYKCAGKPGKPVTEATLGGLAPDQDLTTPRNDICPSGFRSGPDDECVDIDECSETMDDCQHLSQYCINTHGSFFCQDHVSKRCAPGFKVNTASGVCEDIDECEESNEVCKRSEVCVNLPGAYDCKSKISTFPKLAPSKSCQEGLRMRAGGGTCEDIDECREGTHLCDQFQNCINTYGGHECRCKNGFELDSSTGSCADVDECALKLDNCKPGTRCNNVLGSYTCSHDPAPTPAAPPGFEYEYYDSEEENTTVQPQPTPPRPATIHPSSSTTRRPPPRTLPPVVVTTSTTPPTTPDDVVPSPDIPPPPPLPPRPDEIPAPAPLPPSTPPTVTAASTLKPRPFTNRPPHRTRTRPTSTTERTTTSTSTAVPLQPTTPREEDNNIEKEGNTIYCLFGFEKNENGDCVDIDECTTGHHICTRLEQCVNRNGGYYCQCINGYRRDSTGWCALANRPNETTPPTRPATVAIRPTTVATRPTPVATRPATVATRPTTVATRPTTVATSPTTAATRPTTVPTRPISEARPITIPRPNSEPTTEVMPPYWGYNPYGRRPYMPPTSCELGYTFGSTVGKCVDIDECSTNRARCSASERCVNTPGGYHCVGGLPNHERHGYGDVIRFPALNPRPRPADPGVVTVGAQYGQRGPSSLRPSYTRLPETGAVVSSCPWGYELTRDRRCLDVNECTLNSTACGPEQRCENFPGGYSCQCPDGLRMVDKDRCEDVDECAYSTPCSYNAECVNTVGSYRCVCAAGFRNAPSNDKVCVDVDECSERRLCHQECANSWGSYRCYCRQGFKMSPDNNTCVDIDECKEFAAVRTRGRLCRGECVNEPGSYRCSCPPGYRLSDDRRSCIDVDECDTGEATCSRAADPGLVCQNTRGSYHCHQISCPSGYRLEAKHRCTRIQRMCQYNDMNCLQQPSSYSYNFITFVSNIYLENGASDLFTMHGPSWRDAIFNFEMRMLDVDASAGVQPADLRCFDMRPSDNVCVVALLCSLAGPQVAELELTMSVYQRGTFAGSAVARLVVIVSAYEY